MSAEMQPELQQEMILFEDETTGARVCLAVNSDGLLCLEAHGFDGALVLSRERCRELLEWMGTHHLDARLTAVERWVCDVRDVSARVREGTTTTEMRANIRGAFAYIVAHIAEAFLLDSGGENFVLSELQTDAGERLSVTVQRCGGITPLQTLQDAKSTMGRLREALRRCRAIGLQQLSRVDRGHYDAPWCWRARRRDTEATLLDIVRIAGGDMDSEPGGDEAGRGDDEP